MKTRVEQYRKEAAGLLRDVTMYRCLKEEQVYRLYPGKRSQIENLVAYFTREGRIWKCGEYCCAEQDGAKELDRGMIAALWVLIDFIEKVDFHSIEDRYPYMITFFADGAVYTIAYAEKGREALVSHILSTDRDRAENCLIIVESPEQIPEIIAPNITGFCTVTPRGEVQYYRRE